MALPKKFLNQILCGDNNELIKEIPDQCINLVITSPPYYKQRDYGGGIGSEKTVEEYLERLIELFRECVRVLRPDGSIVFNIGDKYENENLLLIPYQFALQVSSKISVKLVNTVTWVKLNPTPRQFKRRLVSSTEPFFHFVKSNDYYYNIKAYQAHLDAQKEKNRGNGKNIGHKYFDLIKSSRLSDEEKEWATTELYEVIREVKQRKISSFRMKIRGLHSPPFGGQEGGRKIQLEKKGFTIIRINGDSLKRDVIECPVETIKGCQHPAIYPEFIIGQFLLLLTKEGDAVLDPYMGSGTTAVACKKMRRNYVGFEINHEYCKYASQRVSEASTAPVLELF